MKNNMKNKWMNSIRNPGLPPGTLLPATENIVPPSGQTLFTYNDKGVVSIENGEEIDYTKMKSKEAVSWLNITGVEDSSLLRKIGDAFGFHPLILEDIQNTGHRPKIENHEDFVFFTMKMLRGKNGNVISEQVTILLSSTYVISFQELEGDVFDSIRKRIIDGYGRVRKEGAPYLAYTLLDAVVDNYFLVLEELETKMEELEDGILFKKDPVTVREIQKVRTHLSHVRRSIWPLQEVLNTIQKEEIPLFSKTVKYYFRDVFDNTLRLVDTIEGLREMGVGLLELYTTRLSNDMNGVMKVLTMIATIFIPLTFIAGIYGMNFLHMPELRQVWGYPAVLGVMGILALGMLLFFKKKKWF